MALVRALFRVPTGVHRSRVAHLKACGTWMPVVVHEVRWKLGHLHVAVTHVRAHHVERVVHGWLLEGHVRVGVWFKSLRRRHVVVIRGHAWAMERRLVLRWWLVTCVLRVLGEF